MDGGFRSTSIITIDNTSVDDPVFDHVDRKTELEGRVETIHRCAKKADRELWTYIVNAVTKDLSFSELKMLYKIPNDKNQYYKSYRRFFSILSQEKHTF